MLRFADIKIKSKLAGLFILAGVLPTLLLGGWGSYLSGRALLAKATSQLESVRQIKKRQIEKFFAEREVDGYALNKLIQANLYASLEKLEMLRERKKTEVESYLAKHLANVRALAVESGVQSSLLTFSQMYNISPDQLTGVGWRVVDKQYRPRFQRWAEAQSYTGLVLVNPDGIVFFSLSEVVAAGTDLRSETLKDTPLHASFQAGLRGPNLRDLGPFAGQQTGFISAPVFQGEDLLGVAILGYGKGPLNALMQQRTGLGQSGASYLVGRQDGEAAFRSDPLTLDNAESAPGQALGADLAMPYVADVLDGKPVHGIYIDRHSEPLLVSGAPVEFSGVEWGILFKITLAEAISGQHTGGGESFLAEYSKLFDYRDILLVNREGDIFYALREKSNHRTNLLRDTAQNGGLGEVFRQALEGGKAVFSDYLAYPPDGGAPAFFLAQPVSYAGDVTLVVMVQLPLEHIAELMQERSGMGETGETYLVGANRRLRSDTYLDPERYSVRAAFAGGGAGGHVDTPAATAALAGAEGTLSGVDYRGAWVLSAYAPVHFGKHTWALLAEIDIREVERPIIHVLLGALAGMAAALVLIVLVARWLGNHLARPLQQAAHVADRLGAGDLRVRVAAASKDETGQMLAALGDMLGNLLRVVRQMRDSAEAVSKTAGQINVTSQLLSQAATEQAASLEQTSASLTEMAASVAQNTDNTRAVHALVERAKTDSEASGRAAAKTTQAMRQIAAKIAVVEDIAYQTNLLALNAGIEAARAGQYGRSFAVVAGEVQKLAQNSQAASKDIRALVRDSVSVSAEAGDLLQGLVPAVQDVAERIEQVSVASDQQNAGIQQIHTAVVQLEQVAQQNASAAEQLAASAEEMAGLAERLQSTVNFFVTPE